MGGREPPLGLLGEDRAVTRPPGDPASAAALVGGVALTMGGCVLSLGLAACGATPIPTGPRALEPASTSAPSRALDTGEDRPAAEPAPTPAARACYRLHPRRPSPRPPRPRQCGAAAGTPPGPSRSAASTPWSTDTCSPSTRRRVQDQVPDGVPGRFAAFVGGDSRGSPVEHAALGVVHPDPRRVRRRAPTGSAATSWRWRGARRLAPLDGPARGRPRPGRRTGSGTRCAAPRRRGAETFERVICSDPHAWRAIRTVEVPRAPLSRPRRRPRGRPGRPARTPAGPCARPAGLPVGLRVADGGAVAPRPDRGASAGSPTERRSEAELAELAGVALPVLGDLHAQVQVDLGARAAPRSGCGPRCRPRAAGRPCGRS